MPIPIPRNSDDKDEYISRCMRFTVGEEKRPQDQAFAICSQKWSEHMQNGNKESQTPDTSNITIDTFMFLTDLKNRGLL